MNNMFPNQSNVGGVSRSAVQPPAPRTTHASAPPIAQDTPVGAAPPPMRHSPKPAPVPRLGPGVQSPAPPVYRGPVATTGQEVFEPGGKFYSPNPQLNNRWQAGITGRAVPANPAIQNPYRPGPFPTMRGRPAPAPAPGQHNQLNWQQRRMQSMPPGMRQAYNGRPMTNTAPSMDYRPSPTRRGQPVGSRVNLQRNQFG